MGPFVAAVLFVLAPQDPSVAAPAPAVRLAAQEQRGKDAAPTELVQLALGDDAAVAARAAYVLGRTDHADTLPALHTLAVEAPHADARAQAMQALATRAKPESHAFALRGLDDADVRVRTAAVQALAANKATKTAASGAALTAFLATRAAANTAANPATDDVVAALLALHDLGARDRVLAVAQTLHDTAVAGVGEALAFLCQDLAPQLPPAERRAALTFLVAHREPAVRRVALAALANLRDPSTLPTLQARAAAEQGELRALAEQAAAVVAAPAEPTSLPAKARRNAAELAAAVAGWWRGLDTTRKAIVGGLPVVLVASLALVVVIARRRSAAAAERAAATAAALALVQPSEDFLARNEAAAEDLAAQAHAVAAEIGLPGVGDEPAADGAPWERDAQATH